MVGEPSKTGSSDTISTLYYIQCIPVRIYLGLIFILGLLALPFQIGTIDLLTMTSAFYFIAFVISWDFLSGYTGQVSFGHTLFFATGGYTTAVLNLEFGVDPFLGIAAGTLLAMGAGLLIGIPALRIKGHYLALFTLLPPLIMLRLFQLFRETFGGSQGLPKPETLIAGADFAETAFLNYYLGFVVFLIVFLLAWIITRSDTGTVFTAIKENEDAVASVGLNSDRYKVYSFVLSAGMGGLAGAVFVHSNVGSASPSQILALTVMIQILIASILGGLGTITGAVVGGLIVYLGIDFVGSVEWTIPIFELLAGFLVIGIGLLIVTTLLKRLNSPKGIITETLVMTGYILAIWFSIKFILDFLELPISADGTGLISIFVCGFAYFIVLRTKLTESWIRSIAGTIIAWFASTVGVAGLATTSLVGRYSSYWGLNWLESVTWTGPVYHIPFGQVNEIVFFSFLLIVVMVLSDGLVPWMTEFGSRLQDRVLTFAR